MSDQIQYLTPNGLRELETRLDYLRNVRRQEVAARLHQALEEGGELVENAEYEDAKNEQAFVVGRISNESPLGRALVGHKVGDHVTVRAPDGNIVFTIKAIE